VGHGYQSQPQPFGYPRHSSHRRSILVGLRSQQSRPSPSRTSSSSTHHPSPIRRIPLFSTSSTQHLPASKRPTRHPPRSKTPSLVPRPRLLPKPSHRPPPPTHLPRRLEQFRRRARHPEQRHGPRSKSEHHAFERLRGEPQRKRVPGPGKPDRAE
jgi:hypothetical protein